jgi:hypothetical protein
LAFPASLSPTPVLTTRLDEKWAAAGGGFLVWTQSRGSSQRATDVYARRGSRPAFKVNRPGTQARTGGVDGTRLVYQEIAGGLSDLRLYDLAQRRPLPLRGVNTKRWEMRPTLWGHRLLFGRIDYSTGRYAVLLHDLARGRERELDVIDRSHRPAIEPGQVNGRYAVWATGVDGVYTVHRYDAVSGKKQLLAGSNPYRDPQYAPSVSRRGTVFFARSGLGCGEGVRIIRAPLRGPEQVVASLRPGFDLLSTYAASGRLLFDRAVCKGGRVDVYQLPIGA